MGLDKKGYYTLKDILPYRADYNIILSGRSIGKSYATEFEKKFDYKDKDGNKFEFMGALREAWERKEMTLGYVRRWQDDIKGQNCAEAFTDKLAGIEELTKGDANFVVQRGSKLYFAKVDNEGKMTTGLCFGQAFALSENERYKSRQFPTITTVIYEEFVTKNRYLPDEPTILQQLISTISRSERKLSVFLIANTINQVCPYFSEWGLVNVPKQKIGTIDKYSVKGTDMAGNEKVSIVCVEYAQSNDESNKKRKSRSQVFIGKAQKAITGGAWETDNFPHLYDIEWIKDDDGVPIIEKETLSSYIYECSLHKFVIELCINEQNGGKFVFVYPAKQSKLYQDLKRFTKNFDVSNINEGNRINKNSRLELALANLIKEERVCFSDNLTGQNFYNCLKEFNFIR